MISHLSIEHILLGVSILIILSIVMSRIGSRFGIPVLILFLGLGMLAGSDGIGGIYFDNAQLAQSMGVVALSYILFAGGLDANWSAMKPVFKQGFSLATIGIVITTVTIGLFASWFLHFSLLEGMLLGAIVSSTDAAAVFSILRSNNIHLKRRLKPLLELESGSNDPMAVLLTLGFISLIQHPEVSLGALMIWFAKQMVIGTALGFIASEAMVFFINRFQLEYEGLYEVFTLSMVILIYALTNTLGGSGFLAVYLCGLLMSRKEFLYRKSIIRFHDGITWLMQIMMFITLGLLVFPSHLGIVWKEGVLVSLFLILVARPLAVFGSLLFARMHLNEKLLLSWVGLRGAAPIVLATFALLANTPSSHTIFNIVFFIVLTSVLVQGTTIPWMAKLLNVSAPASARRRAPLEFEQVQGVDSEMIELIVPYESAAVGKAVFELNLPDGCLITLISRNDKYIVVTGKTIIQPGDAIMALVHPPKMKAFQSIFLHK